MCQSEARLANGRCRLRGSGGRPFKADAKPETVRRRPGRSKLLKSLNIFKAAEDVRGDPEIQGHQHNVELIEALIRSEGDANLGPPKEIWEQAIKLYRQAREEGTVASLIELGDVLERGLESSRRIERILGLMDEQRKHREAEDRREVRLQTAVSHRQLQAFVAQFLAATKEEVKDVALLRAITYRFAQIVGQPIN